MGVFTGKQEKFGFCPMDDVEAVRQRRNALERQKTLEKSYETFFYALDTETTGFSSNEPIQIAAVLFKKGKAVK